MCSELPTRIVAVVCLIGAAATGCEERERAPFYIPQSPPGRRDAGGDDQRDPPAPEDAGQSPEQEPMQQLESGAAAPPAVGCDQGPVLRVLFIGNSHTYTNDVPAMVSELACAAGTRIVSQTSAPGGYGFVEHSSNADALAKIAADEWDFVVLHDQQQRPGFRLEEIEAEHLPAARTLVEAVRAHRAQARPLFYMVWAREGGDAQNCAYYSLLCSFEGATTAVAQGYRLHAERNAAELAPVALAWAAVYGDPGSPVAPGALWSDGSHAARPGSYLAAAVIAGTLLEAETAALTYDGGLDPAVAGYLRRAADAVVRDHREDPRVDTAERVRIACPYDDACSAAVDAAKVTFTLSEEDCAALSAGDAAAVARLRTTASCRGGQCSTVFLGGWHEVRDGSIASGAYQVHAHVDADGNGELDAGDLEGCDPFEVGGGDDLTFTTLAMR